MVRVGLIDDSKLLRARVAGMLAELRGVRVVGEAATLADARRLVGRWHADVVLLDLHLRDGNGLDWLPELKARPRAPAVIVLTQYAYELLRERCLAAGADAFLDKHSEVSRLPAVLRSLARSPRRPPRRRARAPRAPVPR